MINILVPDKLHIHERGFKSIIDLEKEKKITLTFINKNDNLKYLYGNYNENKSFFLKEYDYLSTKTKEELYNEKVGGIELFNLIKAEMLSYLMPKDNWLNSKIESSNIKIFEKAYLENKEDLLLNLSAGIYWFNYWKEELKNHKRTRACIIFSGSLIYVKTISFLLQNTSIKVFVVEHFFTGNDFYFEEKYTHIANNSDIKYSNYYTQQLNEYLEKDSFDQKKDKIKAINKIHLSQNKNVKQPEHSEINFNFNKNKKVLILGQVINDFSIIENPLENINSLNIYKSMIQRLIKETDFNIIFKAHPWEKNKINIKQSLTKNKLNEFIFNEFNEEERKRFIIVEDFNITKLFVYSDIIVGICSQSLIEASFIGKKTHQIGDAFFGKKGFTYDYKNENEFIEQIKKHDLDPKLNIYEYNKLVEFLTIIFQYHLISVYSSGKNELFKKFKNNTYIKIVEKIKNNDLDPSSETKNKEVIDFQNDEFIFEQGFDLSIRKKVIENIIYKVSSEKKFNKFRNNPDKFFSDSNYYIVKILGKFY